MLFVFLSALGALLLFFLEPIAGKALTPWLGGGANVWVGCLLFFQIVLLLGYSYAHVLNTRVSLRWQVRIHVGSLFVALSVILLQAWFWGSPLLVPRDGVPVGAAQRIWPLFRLLGLSVGLPFLVLSATSPLLQAWHSRTSSPGRSFRLYAWSNAGSMLALLLFPLAAEPFLSLDAIAWALAAGLALFAGLTARLGSRVVRQGLESAVQPPSHPSDAVPRLEMWKPLAWGLLSAGGTVVFMAGTNVLSHELSSVPMIWTAPLLAYLASFVLVFDSGWKIGRSGWLLALLAVFSIATFMGIRATAEQHWTLFWGTSLNVLLACLFLHGLLFSLRPSGTSALTAYYVSMSLGGVIGGLCMVLVVPFIYTRLVEYGIGLMLGAFAGFLWLFQVTGARVWPKVVGLIPLVLCLGVIQQSLTERGTFFRDLFGVACVTGVKKGNDGYLCLRNGTIVHGNEVLGESPKQPHSYYHRRTGLGITIEHLRTRKGALRIGLIGLGTGSAAAYAQQGDWVRVYEISPKVFSLAGKHSPIFSYMRRSDANVEELLGDGRLLLEQELAVGPWGFDLLLVDAFSGGNIPPHLLTREAMKVYLGHLAPEGILAMHTSNWLPIQNLVLSQARALGCWGFFITTPSPLDPERLPPFDLTASYVLISPSSKTFAGSPIIHRAMAAVGPGWEPGKYEGGLEERFRNGDLLSRDFKPWTDRSNSLIGLLVAEGRARKRIAAGRR